MLSSFPFLNYRLSKFLFKNIHHNHNVGFQYIVSCLWYITFFYFWTRIMCYYFALMRVYRLADQFWSVFFFRYLMFKEVGFANKKFISLCYDLCYLENYWWGKYCYYFQFIVLIFCSYPCIQTNALQLVYFHDLLWFKICIYCHLSATKLKWILQWQVLVNTCLTLPDDCSAFITIFCSV